MAKRRRSGKARTVRMGGKAYVCKPTKALRTKYKKCILTAIRATKITTRKGAQKAFARAAKKCRAILSGKAPAHKRGRRKGTRRKRAPRLTVPRMGRGRGGSRVSGLMGYTGGRPLYMG
jgi:hypothetical protein